MERRRRWGELKVPGRSGVKEKSYRDRVLCNVVQLQRGRWGLRALMRMLMSICTKRKKKRKEKRGGLTRFLFMPNASCTGVNSVCQLLEGHRCCSVNGSSNYAGLLGTVSLFS